MHSRKGTRFTIAPPTLSLIPGMLGVTLGTFATPAGIEDIGVYSAIVVSARVDIVHE